MTYDRAWKYLEAAGGAHEGDRNNTLNRLSYAILERFPDLSQSEYYELMQRWGHTCSPAIGDSELLKTVSSAWDGAHRKGAVGSKQRSSNSTKRDSPAFKPKIVSSQPPPAQVKTIAKTYDLDATFTALPSQIPDGTRTLLKAAYQPGEKIRIVPARIAEDGGEVPDGSGYVFTREEWLAKLDSCEGDPNGIFSSSKRTGIYIGLNPGGTKDGEITAFRHVLVEFDAGLTLEQQWLLYQQSRLPITAVIYSGGKSIHAWVRVDAPDRKTYDDRVSLLYGHLEASKLNLDKHNRNPARLSRLPNCVRFDKRQELLAVGIGALTWEDWTEELQASDLALPTLPSSLLEYVPHEDEDSLVGNRWLCRGGSLMIVGPSGVGKSSLTMQMAVSWALGLTLFGVVPVRPLKILVVQAENDFGDLAEQMQGVANGLELTPDQVKALDDNLKFFRDASHTGWGWVDHVHRLIRIHKPDVVFADPLLSFVGGDISRQEVCGQFLRNWLGPVSESTGVCWVFVHHTGKPPGDKEARKGWQSSDWAYAGIGSSELTNWARAVLTLRQAGSGLFSLSFAKRGQRAGAKHPEGEPTETVWIRHSNRGICWEQVDPPEEPAEESGSRNRKPKEPKKTKPERIAAMNLHGFLSGCKPEGESLRGISERLESWLATRKQDMSQSTCQAAIQDHLVTSGKLIKGEDLKYRKGPNA